MFRQDINLYKNFAPPPPTISFVTWKALWLSIRFFIGLFIIIYLFSLWEIHRLKIQKAEIYKQVAAYQNEFFALKNSYPALFFSENANESIEKLKHEITTQQTILKTLGSKLPFSQSLLALARVIVPNVWLTEININNSNTEITLKGESLSQSALQTFLDNLINDKTFSKFTLQSQDIQTPDEKNKPNNFTFQITIADKT